MGALLAFVLFLAPPPDFQVVRIIASGDVHGRLLPSLDFESPGQPRRLLGGWEGLAATIEELRTDATLLLDCGEFAFGSPEAAASQGNAQVRFMNLVRYDAAAIGARDFTGGAENLELLARAAAFPVLADPMLDVVLNRRMPLFRPYTVADVRGVRVAVVGLTDPGVAARNRLADTKGLAVESPADQFRRYLPAVAAESADVVVVIGHLDPGPAGTILDSFPQVTVAVVPGPDDGTDDRGGRLVRTGAYGQRLAVVDLLFGRSDRRVYQAEAQLVNVLPGTADSAPALARLLDEFRVPRGDDAAGRCATEFPPGTEDGRVALASLVAQAVQAETEAGVVLLPVDEVESGLGRGPATWRQLFDVAPYGRRLRWLLAADTTVHRLLGGFLPADLAPAVAGGDYFVLGDTARWPLAAQVARLRLGGATERGLSRVVTTELVVERSGVSDPGKLLERDLSECWMDWAGRQDTLRGAARARLYPAVPGHLAPPDTVLGPVNINTATAALLERLPGIGPKTAERIIEYRSVHGRFTSVDELRNVKGIGPKRLEQLRPLVTVR